MARKEGKKIGQQAIKKIVRIIENRAEKLIKTASRNSEFSGRKVIRESDIE